MDEQTNTASLPLLDGSADLAAWVTTTAHVHGVDVSHEPLDVFANAVSSLSDAGVQTDRVEDLLLALSRAGVITPLERLQLHSAYLRQRP